MRKYCLSYDVKPGNDLDFNDLKREIVTTLITNGSTVNFNSPVRSTILFFDNTNEVRMDHWNRIIHREFSETIFYYLCMVAQFDNGGYVEEDYGNPELERNFQRLIG